MTLQRFEHEGPFLVETGKVHDHIQEKQELGYLLTTMAPANVGFTQYYLVYAREIPKGRWVYQMPPS